jgi:glycosyltransferase involved in cell wall biosynthesis
MSEPDISIVVCTYNRAELLRGALTSLLKLATDGAFKYEIVVIDNASTDGTPQVIADKAVYSRHLLRAAREPEKGIVAARNRGIREARGRWIAFFDDDQLADSRWLAELYLGALKQGCRVAGGAVRLIFPEGCPRRLGPTVRMLLGEADHATTPVRFAGRLTPGCGNLLIERTVFDQVGVFQRTVHGRGEDTDLFSRIEQAGIPAWYVPTAIVDHVTMLGRLSDEYVLRLAGNVGEGVAIRQAARLGTGRFAMLWLAKALRLAVVQWPLAFLTRLRGDRDTWLDRRCLLTINVRLLAAGWKILLPSQSRPVKRPSVITSPTLTHHPS